jgi:hypothetical protein
MPVLFDQSKFDVVVEELNLMLDQLKLDQEYLLENNDPEFYENTYLPRVQFKDFLLKKSEELLEAAKTT